jgi:hypothetical protein
MIEVLSGRRETMAVKKAAPAKKTATKKIAQAGKTKKGDSYECAVCGLVVSVDETCGCVDVCDIICCGKPMKAKAKRKPAKK